MAKLTKNRTKTGNTKGLWIMMGTLLVSFLIGTGILINFYRVEFALQRSGIPTTATIIDLDEQVIASRTGTGRAYNLTYKYTAVDQKFTFQTIVSSSFYKAHQRTDKVEILYLPSDPSTSRPKEDLFRGFFVWLVIAIILATLVGYYLADIILSALVLFEG